ncbi:exopolyphosphatase [Candida albicans P57072]|nr:exopolyphosphatase [Candida albicans P94015]KGR12364.1 exopolyphosphatase [Candida albicans P57072]KGU28682.1 exopolyphosphatase [Candida albicans P34048]KGU35200.1 exopolyphosphatase [Candida albicans P57055]KHC38220.1 exopolyphosphatase [Candida albicans P76055]KHC39661.1 exopolyphosphatase [Candida albicans P76067]KHC80407.1 exopolyphosphatase [Candida albicans P78042]
MSIKSYLTNLRQQLKSKSLNSPLTVVTGNQSADMDSVVSALTFAYFSNLHSKQYIIPLINIPRRDLKLRRDIVTLLDYYSITEDLLFFVEDFQNIVKESDQILINLVDHNNIQGDELHEAFGAGKLKVVGIIDHHEDEGQFVESQPRIIRTCGSNSSLVFNYFYNEFFKNNTSKFLETQLEAIKLLLGPLLIDTSGMTQKVEEPDTEAFSIYQKALEGDEKFIQLFANSGDKDPYTNYYSTLKAAKKDVSGFKFVDLLRKDYKQFTFDSGDRVGFSSVTKAFKWIVANYSKEEIEKTLIKTLEENNIDLLIIGTHFTRKDNDKYTREFGYYYKKSENEKFNNLHNLAETKLQLNNEVYGADKIVSTVETLSSHGNFKVFNQGNISASRKQVVPIVKEILEN